MASCLQQGRLVARVAPHADDRYNARVLPSARRAPKAAEGRQPVGLLRAGRSAAPSVWSEEEGQSPFSDVDGAVLSPGEQPKAAAAVRVEDLAPQHWRTHLDKLKPGEQNALRRYIEVVARINALRRHMAALTDEQLAAKTGELRRRLLDFEAGEAQRAQQQGGPSEAAGHGGWSSSRGSAGWPQQRQQRGGSGAGLLGGMPEAVVVEAFAVVREAAQRVLGMRHYDVQLLGGLALHEGQVAEMATGEGKTLVATLPAYLNALTGKGVHVVTVNDYLAKRDAEWIGKVFTFLGLSVGVATSASNRAAKREAMAKDITYITAYDLVFCYLNDYTVLTPAEIAIRRPLHYALVDEVDSILIDEAINPFIMTVPSPSDSMALQQARWRVADKIVRALRPSTYTLYNEACTAAEWSELEGRYDIIVRPKFSGTNFTARGMRAAVYHLVKEGLVALATDRQGRLAVAVVAEHPGQEAAQLSVTYADASPARNSSSGGFGGGVAATAFHEARLAKGKQQVRAELERLGLQAVDQPSSEQLEAAVPIALWDGAHAWGVFLAVSARAHYCFQRDVHYLRRDDKVVIIDLPTGRERTKSVWQAGLHQAVETKEGLPIREEAATSATVSYQSFFSYYQRLAGMTGTGATEEMEFSEAYGLPVVRVPPHRPSRRVDHPMQIFLYREGRNVELLRLLGAALERGRPVLIGTGSVQESTEVMELVGPFIRRMGLDDGVQVSLLNADPARTRFEATYIAQAGLPSSVTIATNLAGRGTDILLGGNPKGLVQMLLENKLLPLMEPGARDLNDFVPKRPLHNLLQTFLGDGEMQRDLPPCLFQAFQQARAQAAALAGEATAGAEGAAGAAAGPATARPPWRAMGRGAAEHAARDAVAWLGRQLEAAEVQKAHLRLHECIGQSEWWAEVDARIVQEQQQQQQQQQQQHVGQQQTQQAGSLPPEASTEAGVQRAEAALQRFILLQWLWFEAICAELAVQVREAGGLCVIMASLPDTRRSELQLRGRSGRQGDPGETHLVLSFDDPLLQVWGETVVKAGQAAHLIGLGMDRQTLARRAEGWEAEAQECRLLWPGGSEEEQQALANARAYRAFLESPVDPGDFKWYHRAISGTVADMEANLRNARDSMRKYDQVADAYRRHVYRLRRMLVQGGSSDRRRLLHVYFQDLSHSIVSRLVDASQPPSAWPLELLGRHLYALVNQTDLDGTVDFNGRPWTVQDQLVGGAFYVTAAIDFDPRQLAADLLAALQGRASRMPAPPVVVPGPAPTSSSSQQQQVAAGASPPLQPGQAQLDQVLGELPPEQAAVARQQLATAAAAARGEQQQQEQREHVHQRPTLRLRERQQLGALRARQAAYEPPPPLPGGASVGDVPGEGGTAGAGLSSGSDPPLSGRYASQARLLEAWVADFLAVQYRNKRELLRQWYRDPANTVGGAAAADADSLVSICERDYLVARLDALWMDFLEELERVRRIVSGRSFSMFDPLEEFQLEGSAIFARLLLDFKQYAAMEAFAPVSMQQIAIASRQQLRLGALVVAPGQPLPEVGEEDVWPAAGNAGAGGDGSSLSSGMGAPSVEEGMDAEDFAVLLDSRPDLARRIEEGSRAVAAERHAAALAAQAALDADGNSVRELQRRMGQALGQTTEAAAATLRLARQQEQAVLDAAQRLDPFAPGPAWEAGKAMVRQAEGAVCDVYLAAVMALEEACCDAAQANAEFEAAGEELSAALARAGDDAGRTAALARMRTATEDTEKAAVLAAAYLFRSQPVAHRVQQSLQRALEAAGTQRAQQGVPPPTVDGSGAPSSSGNSSGGSSNGGGISLADVKVRLDAALERIPSLSNARGAAGAVAPPPPKQEAPPPLPPPDSPVGLLFSSLQQLGGSLQQAQQQQQQQQAPVADTPSALYPAPGGSGSSGSAQEDSSAVIARLAMMASGVGGLPSLAGDSEAPASSDSGELPSGTSVSSSNGSGSGSSSNAEENYARVSGAIWGSRSSEGALRSLSGMQSRQEGQGRPDEQPQQHLPQQQKRQQQELPPQ